MRYLKSGTLAIIFSLLAISLYGQETVVKLRPFDGTAATFVNAQIVADTTANGGLSANRVYEFARGQVYFHNAIFSIDKMSTFSIVNSTIPIECFLPKGVMI